MGFDRIVVNLLMIVFSRKKESCKAVEEPIPPVMKVTK